MIEVACYSCGERYRLSDDKAGKKLRCRQCGVLVDIPHPAATQLVDPPDASHSQPTQKISQPPQPFPPPAPGGSGSKAAIITLSIVGGVIVLAGLTVGIIFAIKAATSDGEEDKSPPLTPYEQHEQALKDLLRITNDWAQAMESVRDRFSAASATERINQLCQEMRQLVDRAERLPPLSTEEERRLQAAYQSQDNAAGQRLRRAMTPQVVQWSRQEPRLQSAILCMSTQYQRLQRLQNQRNRPAAAKT